MSKDTRSILNETYNTVNKMHRVNMRSPQGFATVLADPNAFKTYVRSLSEGLNEYDRLAFARLAKNTRKSLLESSMYQLKPYETLTLPILRNFFPKLAAKELVNVMPIDKPVVIKAFIKPKFRKITADLTGGTAAYGDYTYEFPSNTDISRGPVSSVVGVADASTSPVNMLTAMGFDATMPAHIEKNFTITAIFDSTGGETAVNIVTTVDGVFSVAVTHDNTDEDIISGHVDFKSGILYWESHEANTSAISYTATVSLEENSVNPELQFDMEKIPFTVVDRRITSRWTSNLEQDAKALFDITLQTELINIMGEQIALDIDREIIGNLISMNTTQNAASHQDTFYKIPGSSFVLGQKAWSEELLPKVNTLAAQIYLDTNMGSGNTLACNPLDAALFESLNNFEYVGNSSAGGEVGYKSATVAAGKYKLVVSPNVTQGKVIVKYRSDDLARAVYVFAPYVPALLSPYPLGANPSMTIISRYATQSIRPNGVAVLNISDGTSPI